MFFSCIYSTHLSIRDDLLEQIIAEYRVIHILEIRAIELSPGEDTQESTAVRRVEVRGWCQGLAHHCHRKQQQHTYTCIDIKLKIKYLHMLISFQA